MSVGTITDIVVALVAVASLLLSLYTLRLRRQDTEAQEERWQREEERWEREKQPSLQVTADTRLVPREVTGGLRNVQSLRVVNNGSVAVEIRSFRIVQDGRTFPLPVPEDDILQHLWNNENPVGRNTPYALPSGNSVRFATWEENTQTALKNAGFSGFTEYEVAIVDSLGNSYTAQQTALLGGLDPDP